VVTLSIQEVQDILRHLNIITLIILLPVSGWATTYYIEDISEATPYYSTVNGCGSITTGDTAGDVQAALDAGSGGDTVYLCAGTLSGTELDSDGKIQLSDTTATILTGAGDTSIIDLSGGAAYDVRVVQVDDATISNIKVLGGGVADYPIIVIADTSDTVTISNVTIDNADERNIWLQGGTGHVVQNNTLTGASVLRGITIDLDASEAECDNVTISGNTITGGYHAIYVAVANDGTEHVQNIAIKDNIITQTTEYPIYLGGRITGGIISGNRITSHAGGGTWGRGIELYSSDDTKTYRVTNILIERNYVDGIIDPTVGDTDGVGIGLDDNTADCIVQWNRVVDAETFGITDHKGTDNIIRNNVVIRNGETSTNADPAGIKISPSSAGTQVLNNTIIGTQAGTVRGIYIDNSATNYLIYNNIIYNVDDGIKCEGSSNDCDAELNNGAIADYNLFYSISGANYVNISVGEQGANDQTGDPVLVNTYRLGTGSGALGNGNITYDTHACGDSEIGSSDPDCQWSTGSGYMETGTGYFRSKMP
jgi:hypothetical protein